MPRRGILRLSSIASAELPQLSRPFAASAASQTRLAAFSPPTTTLPTSIFTTPPPFAAWNHLTSPLRPRTTCFAASTFRRTPSVSIKHQHIFVASYSSATATSSSSPASMASNGDSRSKRKQPPTPSNDRPMKQFKPERDSIEYTNGSDPHNGMDTSLDNEEPLTLTRATTTADTAEWQATVESVIKNVVSIHFCQTCSFDTDSALASEATGFVVDAEKGYILTNRVS
jgi:hypothetical protein